MKKILLLCFVIIQMNVIMAQFHVGAIGGYSRSKFVGDTPPSELYGWSGGFTYAINRP